MLCHLQRQRLTCRFSTKMAVVRLYKSVGSTVKCSTSAGCPFALAFAFESACYSWRTIMVVSGCDAADLHITYGPFQSHEVHDVMSCILAFGLALALGSFTAHDTQLSGPKEFDWNQPNQTLSVRHRLGRFFFQFRKRLHLSLATLHNEIEIVSTFKS